MSAIIVAIAATYLLLSLAPVLWPAFVAYRATPRLPRPALFIAVIAALVYGAFSFLGFAALLPLEAYRIFVAPSLETAGLSHGAGLLRVTALLAEYWWVLVPPVQLILTWFVTRQVGMRWAHICAAPPNNSFKPKPLRGSA